MLTSVTDDVAPARGRRYEYDQLVRLTCELAGDPATSGACATTNPAVIGRFTYHDGASTTAPPDHRATAFTRTPDHVSTSPEVRTYAASTNRVTSVVRGSDSLFITYDGLGRRTTDYLASQPTTSRRAYTYLPDGQLHTITTAAGTVTLSYGIGGALSAIDGPEGRQDLTYDDAGRLVAALVEQSGTSIAWEYHYLGDTPIAATRRGDFGTERLGFLHDRRGLIDHVVDTTGKTLYAATHDAAGIATIDDEERLLWLPFALPGQLRLDGTGAPGRGPLFANGARAYDPDLGVFLAPDPADPIARVVPEGYAYARNNPIHFADPSGGAAWGYWDTDAHPIFGPGRSLFFGSDCTDGSGLANQSDVGSILDATRRAIEAIAACTGGACGPLGGTALRARWLFNLSVGRYNCPKSGDGVRADGMLEGSAHARHDFGHGLFRSVFGKSVWLPPTGFTFLSGGCLDQVLAHEALHTALRTTASGQIHAAQAPPDTLTNVLQVVGNWLSYDLQDDHLDRSANNDVASESLRTEVSFGDKVEEFVAGSVEECVKCQ